MTGLEAFLLFSVALLGLALVGVVARLFAVDDHLHRLDAKLAEHLSADPDYDYHPVDEDDAE